MFENLHIKPFFKSQLRTRGLTPEVQTEIIVKRQEKDLIKMAILGRWKLSISAQLQDGLQV
jgi:hypothetical protein